ncbi:hypothetical protein [Treponema endosymbiont of Eucomonympha sp.]|uniref:hypothetical protein n=1 Tax=Treponema endosymbiont of Eucomonympha sp. TaxID=1580831 RepID=UPI000781681D|nr:hypothetical protein [Treponema endosymbiont of Eucomonympha sp.]
METMIEHERNYSREAIVDLFNKGLTTAEIARIVKLSFAQIELILEMENFNKRMAIMEKCLQVKLGMGITEISTLLNKDIVLMPVEHENNKNKSCFTFSNENLGLRLHFTLDTKKVQAITFEMPFSLAVDGIKIGMKKNEVKKIRGKPESTDSLEELGIKYWFYDNGTILYEFEKDGKLSSILKGEKKNGDENDKD